METLHFSVEIAASPEKVWHILWNDTTYPMWTSVFSEGSRAVTTWEKGSRVLFVNADNEGMVSEVADNVPFEFMSFRHLGMVTKGVEEIGNTETNAWYGAMENYTLKQSGKHTTVQIDIDITDEHKQYFLDTWPKALAKLKELAEEK
jgi:uncharacterized protein YndB with AHSA1/START domain